MRSSTFLLLFFMIFLAVVCANSLPAKRRLFNRGEKNQLRQKRQAPINSTNSNSTAINPALVHGESCGCGYYGGGTGGNGGGTGGNGGNGGGTGSNGGGAGGMRSGNGYGYGYYGNRGGYRGYRGYNGGYY